MIQIHCILINQERKDRRNVGINSRSDKGMISNCYNHGLPTNIPLKILKHLNCVSLVIGTLGKGQLFSTVPLCFSSSLVNQSSTACSSRGPVPVRSLSFPRDDLRDSIHTHTFSRGTPFQPNYRQCHCEASRVPFSGHTLKPVAVLT